jgi:4-alpha-glucanotransferase
MIAEDLGHVTSADIHLRDSFGLAPMRIFQFGFGSEPDAADHLPHNYSRVCAAYTGNHDNDTIIGWFRHLRPAQQRRVRTYTGAANAAVHAGAIRALMASPANAAMFPMQDVLGLDHRARMNTPGTFKGNWQWRLQPMKLDRPTRQFRLLAKSFGRTFQTRHSHVTP